MPTILILFVSFFSAWASLDQLEIKNLHLNYELPLGKGQVDKIKVGFSRKVSDLTHTLVAYPVELHHSNQSLLLKSEYIDLSWGNPWPWLMDLSKVEIKELNVFFNLLNQQIGIASGKIEVKEEDYLEWQGLSARCQSASQNGEDLADQIWDNCMNLMRVAMNKVTIPLHWKWLEDGWGRDLPDQDDDERPSREADFSFSIDKKSFAFDYKVKYYVNARLKIWGYMTKEVTQKRVAIRIDKVKFGIIGTTDVFFNLIERYLPEEQFEIKRPWVYVKLK